MARVRLPTSTTTSNLLLGSIAVHTQEGERSRRLMAASSLIAPALNARSTAYTSSSWSCSTWRSQRKYAEKARSCSAASTSQCNTVWGATSKTRAVARIGVPAVLEQKTSLPGKYLCDRHMHGHAHPVRSDHGDRSPIVEPSRTSLSGSPEGPQPLSAPCLINWKIVC